MVDQEEKTIKGNNMMVGTATGFDSFHHANLSTTINPNDQFFNFEQNNSVSHNNSSEVFWKPSSPASNKPIMTIAGTGDFSQFDDHQSSLQRCVLIPCEPNERPSQGLSLSLSSTNPSTIGIQPFELVRPSSVPQDHQGYFGKPMNMPEEHHHDELYTKSTNNNIMNMNTNSSGTQVLQHQSVHYYGIRSSRYLVPAQDILNEFCNLGTNQNNDHSTTKAAKAQRNNQWQDHDNNINATSSENKPLNTLEFLELQKRKSKLLQLLEEVDRKYHNYRHQMKAVVSSFEAVAGDGAATVYSTLASKAMSRHFRCLRDGIVGQIKETKKAMGEKDLSSPGATKGETPRLRLLDQTLRQQRALQQMTMMDNHPWRPQRGLPERSVSVLRAWLFEHFLHPYPSDVDKHILARQTGLSRSQVSNWFINARVRLWKPMVEEMYVEETKDHQNNNTTTNNYIEAAAGPHHHENTTPVPQTMEQKPTLDQLQMIGRRDSDCLSSIIINHHHNVHTTTSTKSLDHEQQPLFGAVVDELDFSSYNHHNLIGTGSSSGGAVSLTLGLQQHAAAGTGGGDGVSLYYPASRDHIIMDDDCQNDAVQYSSLLEQSDQGHNYLPYRNLMGAQLLHDLAG
uniref:homeobox protein BEL1 homolog n=1 Tax=Erigeron canadensis TaxID=72917 RepID=UPI001CB9C138|nr:homeobox protein BEL1 homolog [Erigeron canadensis]